MVLKFLKPIMTFIYLSYRIQLFISENDFNSIKGKKLEVDTMAKSILQSYDAAHFKFKVNTKTNQLFTLHQKMYDGWECHLDNKEVKIIKSNLNFMTIYLPKGKGCFGGHECWF